MDLLSTPRVHKPCLRMLMRCCIALILIWLYHQVTTTDKVNVCSGDTPCHTSSKYNITQANLGRIFFRHLIHDNDSFKHVNEQNVCSLIHFFIQEAAHNGQPIQFSSGMFVLYDSTQRFFGQLMLAKNTQPHSNEHRSGYIRRLVHFALDSIKSIFRMLLRRNSSVQIPFIYMRGDESSHFHERGNKHDRWHLYPAYGMDIMHGCMPNKFSHILFGKLKDLSNNANHHYHGDRIYIKPEKYGLQQFSHYLAHSGHYIRAVSHSFLCRLVDRLNRDFCTPPVGVFHEWTDRRFITKWIRILATINALTPGERRKMQDQAFSEGILELYRQTLLFPSISHVNDFRIEIEHRYGDDVSSRKGHEIIFTTEQLLNGSPTCMHFSVNENHQCDTSHMQT